MKTVMVDIKRDRIGPGVRCKCYAVTNAYGVVFIERAWQVVHLASGLRTADSCRHKRADVEAMATAASRKFSAFNDVTDWDALAQGLRKAGSAKWAEQWWRRRLARASKQVRRRTA